MRNLTAAAILAAAAAAAPWTAAAQTPPGFEELVEDALRRNAGPGGEPPASAVPPRLGVEPAAPTDVPEPRFPAAATEPQPVVPVLPETAAPAPKPYTPPTRSQAGQEGQPPTLATETPADTGAPAAADSRAVGEAPAAGTVLPGPADASATAVEAPAVGIAEASMAALTVDGVNSATFTPEADQIRGASPLILKAQILLDRAGASPGVIDGIYGGNVAKAIAAVETVLALPVDGRLDPDVWAALGGDQAPPVLVSYTITPEDASYPFLPAIPRDYAVQATLPALGFTSPEEMFSERFHMDVKLVKALNPGADLRQAGTTIVVADILGQPVTGKIARIEADKAARQVRAYDAQERLVVAYPATIGSADNPSPSGTHQVNAIAADPIYYYDPRNFVQGENRTQLELPPGPNNPVGTMWIDLSEPSYGIHGTPEPSKIDKTGSHGCVRLTNWDAEELATLVDPGVPVTFIE